VSDWIVLDQSFCTAFVQNRNGINKVDLTDNIFIYFYRYFLKCYIYCCYSELFWLQLYCSKIWYCDSPILDYIFFTLHLKKSEDKHFQLRIYNKHFSPISFTDHTILYSIVNTLKYFSKKWLSNIGILVNYYCSKNYLLSSIFTVIDIY